MLNDHFQSRAPLAVVALGIGLTAAVGALATTGTAPSAPQARCGNVFAVHPSVESALWAKPACF